MSHYIKPDGTRKDVKNLGWFMAKVRKCSLKRIEVTDRKPKRQGGCTMTAFFRDGITFVADFADKKVCEWWIRNRRVIRDVPLNWVGIETFCGRDVQTLGYMKVILGDKHHD